MVGRRLRPRTIAVALSVGCIVATESGEARVGAQKRTALVILVAAALLSVTAFFVLSGNRTDNPPLSASPDAAAAGQSAPQQQENAWDPPVLPGMPDGTVRHVGGVEVEAPQTYEIDAKITGWLNRDNGILCVTLGEGRLLGDIDARSGAETSRPKSTEPDHSERLMGLKVLTGTTPRARGALKPDCTVRLILLPVGDGATLFIDSVKAGQ